MLKKNQAVVGWAYALVMAAGGIATALGLAVIVAWHIHNVALIRLLPAAPPMQYNTALGFLLSGLTLLALAHGQRESAKVLSVVVAALGLLTLSEYIFDINLGIDQLLMHDYLTNTLYDPSSKPDALFPVKQFSLIVDKPLPGRPSPHAALGFALIGTALAFVAQAMQRRKASLIGGLLAAVVAALSLVALICHLSGVVTAYYWGQLKEIAIHAAFGLLVLSTGTIALALYSGQTKRSGLPPWLPFLVGFGVLTTNLFLWQAISKHELAEMVLTGVRDGRLPIIKATLIVVTLAAFLISLVVYFAQIAYKQAFRLEQINQQLTIEISQRQQAEQALQQANEVLETRVQERTTDLMQANVALKVSEERLRLALEAAQMGYWDWNILTDTLTVSQNHNQLYGLSPSEYRANHAAFLERVHPADRESVAQALTDAVQAGADYDLEFRIIWSDGSIHWMKSKGQVFYNDTGKAVRMIGTVIDISDRKQAESEIKASLQEKEVLLKEVHHRVKNNLQVIDSLFRHQCRHTKDKQTIATLKECQNRVTSMALLHEKLYQSKDLSKIDLAEYIRSLVANLFDSYSLNSNLTTININAEQIFVDVETAIPCGLIVNELVSNSLKYAFPAGKNGEIAINFHADNAEKFLLSVKDDGVGLPENFDLNNLQTLGLKLVKSLVRQLGGTLEINSSGGTKFMITFTKDDN